MFNLDAALRQLHALIDEMSEPEAVRETVRIICEACERPDMADEIFDAFLRVANEELG